MNLKCLPVTRDELLITVNESLLCKQIQLLKMNWFTESTDSRNDLIISFLYSLIIIQMITTLLFIVYCLLVIAMYHFKDDESVMRRLVISITFIQVFIICECVA